MEWTLSMFTRQPHGPRQLEFPPKRPVDDSAGSESTR